MACTTQNEQSLKLQLDTGLALLTTVVPSPQPQAPAGQLRNTALPHAKGDYICFLDDDDLIDGRALCEALESAKRNSWDLVCFPYVTSRTSGNWGGGPMVPPDVATWQLIQAGNRHCSLRSQLAMLANYPWIRLTKRALLVSEGVRFGSSLVHNDILFHWHSLACAESVGVSIMPVCSHTYHSCGRQLTALRDKRRLQLFDELSTTHKRLRNYGHFQQLLPAWIAFCKQVSGWARNQIASEYLEAFDARERTFWAEMRGENSMPQLPLLERIAHETQLSRRHRFDFLQRSAVDEFFEACSEDGEPAQERLKNRILSNINLDALLPRQKKRLLNYYRQHLSRQSKALNV